MCAELGSIDGGLQRPVSVSWMIINGIAECTNYNIIHVVHWLSLTFVVVIAVSDGIDFVSSIDTSDSVFPLDSSPGDALCTMISLINDTLFEFNEDFIVELNTGDPSVMISEDANLAVVTIQDVPHHLCKDSLCPLCRYFVYASKLLLIIAVAVSFVVNDYTDTEGVGLFVEVCVQIVFGTLRQSASVNLWTVSQSATGEIINVYQINT